MYCCITCIDVNDVIFWCGSEHYVNMYTAAVAVGVVMFSVTYNSFGINTTATKEDLFSRSF